jgi:hypothetical protein
MKRMTIKPCPSAITVGINSEGEVMRWQSRLSQEDD